ncbi:translocation/assembly module TamB domain-containing protein [Rhodanobacter sp. DHB23]|uniref:translocation/assembly module TamB domain-containing protein n=1 Tax=Rhodanobacter sp. DHB23 TaxID=2775923 RepID=UPI001783B6EB|nr:translocation/assembly module TamB domain-containing protein [Rhodanobacter sp. DHB23]MBD8873211.1 translocation/assembly module TamB domain-containing protein [Rhodanobacter sp. DHB23]
MKWLKRLAIAIAILLLAAATTLWWLLDTGAGLRFALTRAQSATHGALQWRQAQGALLGPLQLDGLRYDDGNGTRIDVAHARLDLRFWPLLARRLHVRELDAEGVTVALPKSDNASENPGGFSLQPPIDLRLDRAHVGTVQVSQAGQPVFASDSLDLAGSWTKTGIAIDTLKLRAPDGHVDLEGRLALASGQRGNGKADFAWQLGDTRYAGQVDAHGDGRQARLELQLAQPMAAHLQLDLGQDANHDWKAALVAPRFDPRPLLGDSAPASLALSVQGHGDRHGGELDGTLDLDQYRVLLQPLRASLGDDGKTLVLQQLALASPQVKGALSASGRLRLDAKPLGGQLAIQWSDLQLPAELAGQPLASTGKLEADGNAERFHASGEVAIGPPGKPTQLTLDLDGTPQAIALHPLALRQAQGQLQAQGTLQLQPVPAWQVHATATRFDPGQLFAGWNGALDLALDSQGTLAKTGPDATLELKQLGGRLRDRSVGGTARLHLSPDRVVDGQLKLSSGGSTVQLDARPGQGNDATLKLAIASLGDWLPGAAGHLDGQFAIRGLWPRLSVNGHLDGSALAWQQQRVDTLQLVAGIPDISHPAGKLELATAGSHIGGLLFQRIHLLAEGSQGDHRLALEAHGSQVSGTLALHGALKNDAWTGTLSTLDLEPQGLPGWRLQNPSQLAWRDGAFSLGELCLTAGDPQLCASARQDKAGNLDASYRLRALPLALLLNATGESGLPVRVDGNLQGDGQLRRSAAGALSGHADIGSSRGSITWTGHADAPLLSYDDFALDARLAPDSQRIALHAALDHGGRLDGQMSLTGKQQSLAGQLDLRLDSLAFVELFGDALANVRGQASGSFRLGGTLAQPAISGDATLADFAAEVPAAGLKLAQGRLTASAIDAHSLRVDGSVQSGTGTLAVNGVAGLGGDVATDIAIKGSRFTAADIPAARVVITPDLRLQRNAQGLDLGGTVSLDSADVNLDRLPGAGASKASPDVVVVDRPPPEPGSSLPFTATVKVDLGSKTHLAGMGLDGRLGGVLTVNERPGRATTGQGQVTVSGTYKAYGQNLAIQSGKLLFASTPIDNPGLDIRAIRKLNPNATVDEGQEVGLQISGTAQRPVLTVFSNPLMEQSDALSYLVTGKPLSQVKGGEGDMLGAAAQALGSAAGNLLAKSIGSKIGVDDIGVSSNEALGGNSAFTVGKYLSPRLYLSYGVGLFEPGQVVTLRYRLNHRWNFEAQSATDFNRASFNYRYER